MNCDNDYCNNYKELTAITGNLVANDLSIFSTQSLMDKYNVYDFEYKKRYKDLFNLIKLNPSIRNKFKSNNSDFINRYKPSLFKNNLIVPRINTTSIKVSNNTNISTIKSEYTNTDGSILITDDNNKVNNYFAPPFKLKKVITGHTDWVRNVIFFDDNDKFITCSNDTTVKIWELATGKLKITLTGHKQACHALCLNTSNDILYVGGDDRDIKIWDLNKYQSFNYFHGHMGSIYSLAHHPTLNLIISGSRDKSIRLWDPRCSDEIMKFDEHKSTVWSLLAQPYEPQIISTSSDKTIRTWDIRNQRCIDVRTNHSRSIRDIIEHPRLYTYITAGSDTCKIWYDTSFSYERDLEKTNYIINKLAIKDYNNNSIVIGGTHNGKIVYWDYNSGKYLGEVISKPHKMPNDFHNGILSIGLDKSETRLITCEMDHKIKIWNYINKVIDEDCI